MVRELIVYCRQNQIDLDEKPYRNEDRIVKMLEQIHLAIPHLVYMNRAIFDHLTQGLEASQFNQLRESSLQKTTEICGDFQTASYQWTSFSYNSIGFKIAPIELSKSQWSSGL